MSMTLVTGATGLVGRRVVQALRADGLPVRSATRRPSRRDDVRFDLTDPRTFAPALDGVGRVMLVSRPGDEDAHLLAAPFVDAMAAAGVGRVVVLSALGASERPEFSLRRVECLVEASGMAWTHVRPNFFMQMLAQPPLSTEIAERGLLRLPVGNAAVAYVDADDVAAVIHRALVDPALAGKALDVNGPEGLAHAVIAERLSAVLGRPVRFRSITDAGGLQLLRQRGFDERHAHRVITFYRLIREGFCARPDAGVAAMLGRPLRTFAGFASRNASAWARTARAAINPAPTAA